MERGLLLCPGGDHPLHGLDDVADLRLTRIYLLPCPFLNHREKLGQIGERRQLRVPVAVRPWSKLATLIVRTPVKHHEPVLAPDVRKSLVSQMCCPKKPIILVALIERLAVDFLSQ